MNNLKKYLLLAGLILGLIGLAVIITLVTHSGDSNQKTVEQQVSEQDRFTYSPLTINFVGFSQLTGQGMTSDQLTAIQTTIFNYSNTIKKEFKTVTLNASSLNIVFHDPTDRTANTSSATFSITADGTPYTVRTEYPDFGNNLYTRIYDANGTVVFDNSVAAQ